MESKHYLKTHWLLSLIAFVSILFLPLSLKAEKMSAPTNVRVTNLAPTSAMLEWDVAAAGRHDYEIRVATRAFTSTELGGSTAGTITAETQGMVIFTDTITLAEPNYSLTGLSSGTYLYVYIRENGAHAYAESSSWTSFNFSTPCAPTSDLPISVTFNDVTTIPSCWLSDGSAPTVQSTIHHGDEGKVIKLTSSSSQGSFLYSPFIAQDAEAYYLTAYVYGAAGASYVVGVALTSDLSSIETLYEGTITTANTWTLIDVVIPADKRSAITADYVWCIYTPQTDDGTTIYVDDIEISAIPACIKPNGLAVSNLTSSSAQLSWTERGTATAWAIEYSDGTGTNQVTAADSNPFSLELTSDTYYTVKVKADCGEDNESDWSDAVTFKTPCGALDTLSEGFEEKTNGNSSASAPDCWELLNANDGAFPYIYVNTSSTFVHSGTKSLYFQSSSSRYGYAILPEITDLNTKEMAFYYKDESVSSSGQLWIGYMTDITSESSFVSLKEFPRSTSWQLGEISFANIPAEIANTARLAFKYGGASNNYYLGIDDITISPLPSCPKPTDLHVASFDAESATLEWTKGGSESAWALTYQLGDNEAETVPVTGEPTHTISGLTAATSYTLSNLSLRAVCDESDSSPVASFSNISFATACGVLPLPWEENFDNSPVSTCWILPSGVTMTTVSSSYANSGTGVLRFATSEQVVAVLPDFGDLNGKRMSFTYRAEGSGTNSSMGFIKAGYLPDPTDISTFVVLEDFSEHVYQHTPATIEFGTNVPAGARAAILYYGATLSSWYLFMDDFVVEAIPTCEKPGAATVEAVSAERIKVTITDNDADHTAWQVIAGVAGFDKDAATPIDLTAKSSTVDLPFTMAADSTYEVYVRANCGGSDGASYWLSAGSFTFVDWSKLGEGIIFSSSGTYPWTLAQEGGNDEEEGVWKATSGNYHVASSNSDLKATFTVADNSKATLSFDYYVSSEGNTWDYLCIYIDGADNYDTGFSNKGGQNGQSGTYSITFTEAGEHTILWRYRKDSGVDKGDDLAKIFNVNLSMFSCVEPTSFTRGAITANTAVLNWSATTADRYEVLLYDELPEAVGAEALRDTIVSTTSITFEELEANTAYYAYVRSVCGEEHSDWSVVTSFRTECEAVGIPYREGFEDEDAISCWKVVGTGATVSSSADAFAGSKSLSVSTGSDPVNLVLPKFDIETLDTYDFNFAVKADAATGLHFGVYTGNMDDYVPFNEHLTISSANVNKWVEYTFSLADWAIDEDMESARYLAVQIPAGVTVLLDAVEVVPPAVCPKPTAMTVQPNGEDVVVDWTSDATSHEAIIYLAADAAQHELELYLDGEVIAATQVTKPLLLDTLVGNTTYQIRVRAICDGSPSQWSNLVTFKSPCAVAPLPFSENFDELDTVPDATYSLGSNIVVFPDCWNYSNDGTNMISAANTTSTSYISANSGNNAIVFSGQTEAYVFLPTVSGSDGRVRLTFAYRQESTYSSGTFLVGYLTTAGNEATFVKLDSLVMTQSYATAEVVFPEMEYVNAAIKYIGAPTTNYYAAIDDVQMDIAPDCVKPSAFTTSNVTTNSIKLTWNANSDESQWQLIFKRSDKATIDSVIVSNTPEYTINNLASGTNYTITGIQLRAICSETDSSEVYTPAAISFVTECAAVERVEEDFENVSDYGMPNCWTIASTTDSDYPYVYNSEYYEHSGTKSLYATYDYDSWSYASYPLTAYVALPEVSGDLRGYRLTFYAKASSTYYARDLVIGVMDDVNDIETFVSVATITPTSSYTDEPYTVLFNEYSGTGKFVTIKYDTIYTSIYIDDVVLEPVPSCEAPAQVSLKSVDTSSASFVIADAEDASKWEYVLNSTENEPVTTEDPEFSVDRLTPQTEYILYVRRVCGENNASTWRSINFATACLPQPLPLNEPFDGAEIPDCWSNDHVAGTSTAVWSIYNGQAYMSYQGTGNEVVLMTPHLNVTPNKLHEFSFDYTHTVSASWNDILQVTLIDGENRTLLREFTSNDNTATKATYEFTFLPTTDIVAIEFRTIWANGSGMYIDNVMVDETPDCLPLLNLTATNIQRRSFDVVITPKDPSAQHFDLVISETALTDEELAAVTPINLDTTVYHVAERTRETTYYIYARQNCGEEDGVGEWMAAQVTTRGLAACEEPIIGAGRSSTSYAPVYGSWTDSQQRTQTVYPADMLTEMLGQTISKLHYNVTSGSSGNGYGWDDALFEVRMGITSLDNLSSGYATETLTTVYHGYLNASVDDGMDIVLSTPFVYNGGNLVIEFEELQIGTRYNSCTFKADDIADASRYEYSSNSSSTLSSRPQVVFTYCYNTDACPAIDITTVSHEFVGDGTSAVTLSWLPSDGDYANSYDILVSDTAVLDFTDLMPTQDSVYATSAPIENLEAYTDYFVYFRTNCDAEGQQDGSSAWSEAYLFKTKSACDVVTDVRVEITGKNSAVLSWSSEDDHFVYFLADDILTSAEQEEAVKTSVVTTTVGLDELINGHTYYAYVAHDCEEEGVSPFIVSAPFTMPESCPAVVNLASYYLAHNAVGLNWNRGFFGAETAWEVGIVDDETSVRTISDSTYMFIGLQPDSLYTFYVKALCSDEENSLAATIELRTAQIPADEVTIADGTSTGYGPICGYYGYERNGYIFTPEDGLSAGTIRSIAWQYYTADKTIPAKIYMKNTTESEFSSTSELVWNEMIADATLVFDATVTTVADWLEINITDFNYTGGNLMILVASNIGGGGNAAAYAYYSTGGNNSHCYVRKDNSIDDGASFSSGSSSGVNNQRHNIRFDFEQQAGCRKVMNLAMDTVTTESATFSWLPGGDELSWAVYNSAAPRNADELDALEPDTIYEMTTTVAELSPFTDYYFYITGICSDSTSSWKEYPYKTIATCPALTAVAPLVEEDHAVFAWTNSLNEFSGHYVVAYGLAESFNLANPTTYRLETVDEPSVEVAGLANATLYSYAVKAVCSDDDESVWSNIVTFRSECAALALPYVENFDGYTDVASSTSLSTSETAVLPDCWQFVNNKVAEGNYVYPQAFISSTSDYNVTGNALFMKSKANEAMYAELPKLRAEEGDLLSISFYYRIESTYSSNGILSIGYLSENNVFRAIRTLSRITSMTEVQLQNVVYHADSALVFQYMGGSSDNYYASVDNLRIAKLGIATPVYDVTCTGDDYEGYGFTIAASQLSVGQLTFTRLEEAVSDLQADSLYTLVLNVGETKTTNITDTACLNSLYNKYGYSNITVTADHAPYYRPESTATGCDSAIYLTLYVPQSEYEVTVPICEGESYTFGTDVLTEADDYEHTFTSVECGCDSTVHLHLVVLPAAVSLDTSICEGDSVLFDGEYRKEGGPHVAHLTNMLGCDSVVTLNLTVLAKTYEARQGVFCSGSVYNDDDFVELDSAGVYTAKFTNAAGCDSIITLTLVEHAPEAVTIDSTIVQGTAIVIGGNTYTEADTYTIQLEDAFGCDSVITLHLTVSTDLEEVLNAQQLKGAEKFVHNGVLYIRANDILYDAQGKRVIVRKED